jgi:hypothetical protein
MINPRGHNHQIALLQPHPHPLIPLAPDIEIPRPVQDIPNLLVLVQMLVEECLHLVFVGVAERGGRNGDYVAVFVGARGGEGVDVGL